MSLSTETATGRPRIEAGRKVRSFSADAAESSGQRPGLVQAVFTHRKPGNFNQWSATNAAIGGKKSKEEAGSNALCPASDRSGRSCGLGSPYSKPGTAEDALPHPEYGAAAPDDKASIAPVSELRNVRPLFAGCWPRYSPVDFWALEAEMSFEPRSNGKFKLTARNSRLEVLWWARLDSNQEPTDYESAALTVELRARSKTFYRLAWSRALCPVTCDR